MKHCILNVSCGAWYPAGQKRLRQSLLNTHYDGDVLFWENTYPPGASSHNIIPYGFKTWACLEAKAKGYELILWLDSSMWAIKNPKNVFDYIERNGWLFESVGYNAGQICSDAALKILDREREELFKIPCFSAGFLGLNLRNEKSIKFLEKWHYYSSQTKAFVGPWTNKNGEASSDKRVIGHRHDLVVGGIIAHDLEMKITPPIFMNYFTPNPKKETVFLARGM